VSGAPGVARTQLFVGAVVRRDGEVLLVRQSPGHSLAGQWTIPWGHVEPGESPMAAALREAFEEAGVEAEVEGLLGVQELPAPLIGGVGLVYLCRHLDGDLQPRDGETDAARYVSLAALDALGEPKEPWSDWLVRRWFADALTVTRVDSTNPLRAAGSFL
jgi:ADP-ribose pyrophosphatase YjhB (NUDIX family)